MNGRHERIIQKFALESYGIGGRLYHYAEHLYFRNLTHLIVITYRYYLL